MQPSANNTLPEMEESFSLDNLTAKDKHLLADYVFHNFPITRNSEEIGEAITDPLERMLAAVGMEPKWLWINMSGVKTVELMIAAAALRCVRRLPDDPRLDPLPHAPAPVKLPRTPEERLRAKREEKRAPVSATGDYLIAVAANPKRKGSASWDRFNLYRVGLSRAQLRAAGLSTADFRYDTDHGYISWGDERGTSFDPGEKLTNDASAIVHEDQKG